MMISRWLCLLSIICGAPACSSLGQQPEAISQPGIINHSISTLIRDSSLAALGKIVQISYDRSPVEVTDSGGTKYQVLVDKILFRIENVLNSDGPSITDTIVVSRRRYLGPLSPGSNTNASLRPPATDLNAGRRYLMFLVNANGVFSMAHDFSVSWVEVMSGRRSTEAIEEYGSTLREKIVGVLLFPGDLESNPVQFTTPNRGYVISGLEVATLSSLALCEPHYSIVIQQLNKLLNHENADIRTEACLLVAEYDVWHKIPNCFEKLRQTLVALLSGYKSNRFNWLGESGSKTLGSVS